MYLLTNCLPIDVCCEIINLKEAEKNVKNFKKDNIKKFKRTKKDKKKDLKNKKN